jgi:Family of unknown function (DUF6174)
MTVTTRALAATRLGGAAAVLVVTALAGAAGPTPALAAPEPAAVPIPVEPFVPRASDDDQLVRAWQQWRSQDVDDYTTRVRRVCFCPPRPALRTEVHADRTQLVTTVEAEPEVRRVKGYGADRLFRLLRRAYADADSVRVTWSDTGLPRRIRIDAIAGAADDEVTYRVRFTAG